MQTIKVLNSTNPHRAESRRAKAFNAAIAAKTVEDYKASPFAKPKYLQRWQAMGLIKLEGEAPVKAVAAPKAKLAKVLDANDKLVAPNSKLAEKLKARKAHKA